MRSRTVTNVAALLNGIAIVAAGGPGNYAHYAWPALPSGSAATAMCVCHLVYLCPACTAKGERPDFNSCVRVLQGGAPYLGISPH